MRHDALRALAILDVALVVLFSGCGNSMSGSIGPTLSAPRAIVAAPLPVETAPALPAAIDPAPEAVADAPAVAPTQARAEAPVEAPRPFAPPRPGRAAAVGDSITFHGGYVSVLNRLPGYRWENLGVRGATTANIRCRTPRRSYGEVLVMGGLNDFSPRVGSAWTIGNLREAYQRARESGARVVAVTSTPCRGSARWTAEDQRDQDEVNRWILGGADGLVDVAVDAYTALEAPEGSDQLDPRYAQPDHLHLTRDGQRRLAQAIIDAAYPGMAVD
jgi:lysophospholipase L1-like esterase